MNESPYFTAKCQGKNTVTIGTHRQTLGQEINIVGKEKSDGVYANWKWTDNQLTVTNDRFGFFTLNSKDFLIIFTLCISTLILVYILIKTRIF